jgi:hypothetical protein
MRREIHVYTYMYIYVFVTGISPQKQVVVLAMARLAKMCKQILTYAYRAFVRTGGCRWKTTALRPTFVLCSAKVRSDNIDILKFVIRVKFLLGLPHRVVPSDGGNISEVYAASIFRVGCWLVPRLCLQDQRTGKALQTAPLRGQEPIKTLSATDVFERTPI